MADQVLSQDAIDAILANMTENGGEGLDAMQESKSVKMYDFKNPRKFGADHIRSLHMIHENFARLLTTFFASRMRMSIEVTLRSVTQFTFGEFMANLDNPTVIAKFKLNPLPGLCVLEFSQTMLFAITERLFGGGNQQNTIYPQRALTDIELRVAQHILSGMLGIMQEAWKPVGDGSKSTVTDANGSAIHEGIKAALQDEIETNPMFTQIAAPSEVLAALTFEMTIGDQTGHFVMALPFATVEPVLSSLEPHRWFEGGNGTPAGADERKAMEESVRDSLVPVTVELGRAQISLGQFMGLQPGATLMLNSFKTEDVPVYVGNRLTFHGVPGVSRGKVAVNIRRISFKKDHR